MYRTPMGGKAVPIGTVALALLVLSTASAGVGKQPEAPAPPSLPALADSFLSLLEGKLLRAPDGTEVALAGGDRPLLDRGRLLACLQSLLEADAWPAAWLVVQDLSHPFDVAIPLRLGPDGQILLVDSPVAVERRSWDTRQIEKAFRQVSGRRPPRLRTVVIQSFARRVSTRYVYRPPAGGEARKGLLALLPEGSLLREARRVELGDGKLHTLALVLSGAAFEPSACESELDRALGHHDTGEVWVILAGEDGLEDRLELGPAAGAGGGRLLLPRYGCEPGDEKEAASPPETWFRERTARPLLVLDDLDGDGQPLEASILVGVETPEGKVELRTAVLAIAPKTRKLRLASVEPF